MNRRAFFGRGAALAASAVIPGNAVCPTSSLRDIVTVRAGDALCMYVDTVNLDGVPQEWVAAFNVSEGWCDLYTPRRPLQITRKYGKVAYALRGDRFDPGKVPSSET